MWVKICGNTRLEDCQSAAALSADAVGFVFAAGKRTVDAPQVAAVTASLPAALEKIGVFDSTDADAILAAVAVAGLTGVQLHTAFDPVVAGRVRRGLPPGGKLIQVVHWYADQPAAEQASRFREEVLAIAASGLADAVLLDTQTRSASGGTGVALDWSAAASALSGTGMAVILAGGLKPENVAEAIRVLQPDGVDVSSGVETSPGVKDAVKVAGFIALAKAV